VVSLGDKAKGSVVWSNSGLGEYTAPNFARPATLYALKVAGAGTVNEVRKGAYSYSVCVSPDVGDTFRGQVGMTVMGSTFKLYPSTVTGNQGTSSACGQLGTATTT